MCLLLRISLRATRHRPPQRCELASTPRPTTLAFVSTTLAFSSTGMVQTSTGKDKDKGKIRRRSRPTEKKGGKKKKEARRRWQLVAMRSAQPSSLGPRFHSIVTLASERGDPGWFAASCDDASRRNPLARMVRARLDAAGFVSTGPRIDSFDFDAYTRLDDWFDEVWPVVQDIARRVAEEAGATLSSTVNINGAHVHVFTPR